MAGVGLAGCGGDDTTDTTRPDREATTAPASNVTGPRNTADDEPTTTTANAANLEGTWLADAGDLVGGNGGTGTGLACTGPISMTFEQGTFTRTGTVTCTAAGMSGSGTLQSRGTYTTDGDQLTITGTTNTGTMTIAGRDVPFPDSWGDGTGTYTIDGPTLTITFVLPTVGTVTQTYNHEVG
jgi:hypothetical protein